MFVKGLATACERNMLRALLEMSGVSLTFRFKTPSSTDIPRTSGGSGCNQRDPFSPYSVRNVWPSLKR